MTTASPLKVAYVGNFVPEHSTENHVLQALRNNGHLVEPLQENRADTWERLGSIHQHQHRPDVVLWTRTGWDWPAMTGWSLEEAHDRQRAALEHLASREVPTIGFHLDRWWGLDREGQVHDEPFFECSLVATADGGHDREWEAAGVEHVWMPPGVLLAECQRTPNRRPEYDRTPVVWVGSWQSYHAEWLPYRQQLIRTLRRRYRRQLGLYPRRGHGLRGQELADLYAAAKVVVGDSCLAGDATHYWSDRIPETVGRGGLLVHPEVHGLADHFEPGRHLLTYQLGDFDQLCEHVDWALAHPDEAQAIRTAGQQHVMEHHTYERRMDQLLAVARERGLL